MDIRKWICLQASQPIHLPPAKSKNICFFIFAAYLSKISDFFFILKIKDFKISSIDVAPGNALSIPVSVAGGSSIRAATGASGVIFLMYSPLYTLLLTGHGPRLVAHKCTAVFFGCAASATLVVVGNLYPLTIAQNNQGSLFNNNVCLENGGHCTTRGWVCIIISHTIRACCLSLPALVSSTGRRKKNSFQPLPPLDNFSYSATLQ